MDLVLSWVNALASGLISLALIGAILSPRVHDGVIVKIGFICLAAGFGAIALHLIDGVGPAEVRGLERSLLLVNAGIAVVILGYLLRKARSPRRRASDFVELDPLDLTQASGGRKP